MFNRSVDWAENMRVVAWVAYLSRNEGLQRWHRMQCIKMKSTLRIGPKNVKNSPRIVKRVGDQNEQMKNFARANVCISWRMVQEFVSAARAFGG